MGVDDVRGTSMTAGRGGELTHLDEHGRARMVDVTGKPVTTRRAVARCVVRAAGDALRRFAARDEDDATAAEVAGVQGAKLTYQLIPLCHPLPLDDIEVHVEHRSDHVEIWAITTVQNRTGVEMEALTACGVAGLSVLAALVPEDPGAYMDELTLWHKSGGRSGTWERAGGP